MENNVVIALLVNWLSSHGHSDRFDKDRFMFENNIPHERKEMDCITKFFRDGVIKTNDRCAEITESAKNIVSMDDGPLKEHSIKMFSEYNDISLENWLTLKTDEKFEHAKKVMENIGVYYRALETKNSRGIWIVPNFEQRVAKTRDVSYSRLFDAIKSIRNNIKLLLFDDTETMTMFEVSSEMGMISPLQLQIGEIVTILNKRMTQLSSTMAKLLKGGNTKGT